MRKIILSIVLLLSLTFYSSGQIRFYIQKGSNYLPQTSSPSDIVAKEWKVILYRHGAPKSGNNHWGLIKGSSAAEVMKTLKESQDFELRYNEFIGRGRVQDKVLTYFNALGPIAVLEDDVVQGPKDEDDQDKGLLNLAISAREYFSTYQEVKKKLDIILKGKLLNPYSEIGKLFIGYTKNLKDQIARIKQVQMMMDNMQHTTADQLANAIRVLGEKSQVLVKSQNDVTSFLGRQNAKLAATASAPYAENLSGNLPAKFKQNILAVLNAGQNISQWKENLPAELTANMSETQILWFKKFVEDIYYYRNHISYGFGILDQGSAGFNYFSTGSMMIDEADAFYRENVLPINGIMQSGSYYIYYSSALLDKATAAYNLYNLFKSDASVSAQTKRNLLLYSQANLQSIYTRYINGYTDDYVLKNKQKLLELVNLALGK